MPIKLQANVSLKKFTTFKIGGFTRYFTCINTFQDALSSLRFANNNKLSFLVIGKGSNILIDSKGFDGIVILNRIEHLVIEKNKVTVGSGYRYPLLANKTLQCELTGLEFATNIPATVGGAVLMNAGANGYETADYLEKITFLADNLELLTLKKDELDYSYRKSVLQKRKGIILEATFKLKYMPNGKALKKELTDYRLKTQPSANYSAGCIFKNPSKEVSAGFLIEKCKLKKKRIGGAVVSEKHANFIINEGNATSDDVVNLINYIKHVVKEKTGYILKEEVRRVPYGK